MKADSYGRQLTRVFGTLKGFNYSIEKGAKMPPEEGHFCFLKRYIDFMHKRKRMCTKLTKIFMILPRRFWVVTVGKYGIFYSQHVTCGCIPIFGRISIRPYRNSIIAGIINCRRGDLWSSGLVGDGLTIGIFETNNKNAGTSPNHHMG